MSDDRAESVSHDKEESTLRQGEAVCCAANWSQPRRGAQQEEAPCGRCGRAASFATTSLVLLTDASL